ncbi:hypothetical protein CBR_g70710 [Chara braunii]|uniref:Reverse transcriptase domain-containing protein n=1 Tax=Chara braunii TaxID=69332 RepID=A0A388K9U4_CHABU|nr:hypothetical protein CBR_g70710 [Chara braunii]|eukprot:GBG66832.1 hypothetical protein CBR_g70710 [Chara braunii]
MTCRVETRGDTETTPYTKEQEEEAAKILAEQKARKEEEELVKQAKKLALLEEQAAKKKKLEEELERLKKEEEEKLKAVEEEEEEEKVEEEVPLIRRARRERVEPSGTQKEDPWLEKNVSEWVADLSLGEEEEAMLYVLREEQEAVVKESESEEDPLRRQTIEDEKKLQWKLCLARDKKKQLEEASKVAKELEAVKEQSAQMEVHADVLGKMEVMARNIELLARAQEEQYQFARSQDVTLRSIGLGFREFARKMMMHMDIEVKARMESIERFCTDPIEGTELAAPREEEARPRRDPVKVKPWLDRFVVVYSDDILLFSKTLQEHEGHQRQVLEKLREANFKINAEKCEWAKTQLLYLGHVLDGDGIKPEDSKIAAIRDWPTPRTLTELRSFLGLANYYRKFVRNFSTIAAPLRRLLKKEAIWEWDRDCTSALKKLKRALIEYPVLKVADPSLPFVVTTDACQYGIGVVLQQDDGNGYRPVEFTSARMPSEKVATSTYERELYPLRQALDHSKHYLLGRHFKLYSDHETLRWLKTQAKMTPKLTRWAAEIDQFDFELKPVKGKYNVVADALSRRAGYFGAIVHYLDIGRDLQQKVKEAYAQDPIYSDLLKRVEEFPESERDYRTTDGLLFEKTNVADRLCVPNSEEIRSLILGECHDTEGYFGWQKTLANLIRAYTWPGPYSFEEVRVITSETPFCEIRFTHGHLGLHGRCLTRAETLQELQDREVRSALDPILQSNPEVEWLAWHELEIWMDEALMEEAAVDAANAQAAGLSHRRKPRWGGRHRRNMAWEGRENDPMQTDEPHWLLGNDLRERGPGGGETEIVQWEEGGGVELGSSLAAQAQNTNKEEDGGEDQLDKREHVATEGERQIRNKEEEGRVGDGIQRIQLDGKDLEKGALSMQEKGEEREDKQEPNSGDYGMPLEGIVSTEEENGTSSTSGSEVSESDTLETGQSDQQQMEEQEERVEEEESREVDMGGEEQMEDSTQAEELQEAALEDESSFFVTVTMRKMAPLMTVMDHPLDEHQSQQRTTRGILKYVVDFYSQLGTEEEQWTSEAMAKAPEQEVWRHFRNCLDLESKCKLEEDIEPEEVERAIAELPRLKAPWMDGMPGSGIAPNVVSYGCLIQLYSKVVYSIIINGFCKAGDMAKAQELVCKMKEEGTYPNHMTYTSIIDGYARLGDANGALETVKAMRKAGYRPNTVAYNCIIKGLLHAKNVEKAEEILREMTAAGVKPDLHTYTVMMDGLARNGQIEKAFEFFRKVKADGIKVDEVTYGVLVNACCKVGRMQTALALANEMRQEMGLRMNNILYVTLMDGWAQRGDVWEVADLMLQMRNEGLPVDAPHYCALIGACGRAGDMPRAMETVAEMERVGIKPSLRVFTALITGWARVGNPAAAVSVYRKLKSQGLKADLPVFHALLSCLITKAPLPDGVSEKEILSVCDDMKDAGIVVDARTASFWDMQLRKLALPFAGGFLNALQDVFPSDWQTAADRNYADVANAAVGQMADDIRAGSLLETASMMMTMGITPLAGEGRPHEGDGANRHVVDVGMQSAASPPAANGFQVS